MLRILTPDVRVARVQEIDAEFLSRLSVGALLLDVDCTLKRYRGGVISEEVVAWVETLRGAGVGLCLVSNGGGARVQPVADRLRIPFVASALKPLPGGCRAAVARMGFDTRHTAMVGDQLFADVAAGRLAGLRTILVDPIHPEEEPWYTRVKRPLERFLVRRFAYASPQPPEPLP
jgi:uncharacterized protein